MVFLDEISVREELWWFIQSKQCPSFCVRFSFIGEFLTRFLGSLFEMAAVGTIGRSRSTKAFSKMASTHFRFGNFWARNWKSGNYSVGKKQRWPLNSNTPVNFCEMENPQYIQFKTIRNASNYPNKTINFFIIITGSVQQLVAGCSARISVWRL